MTIDKRFNIAAYLGRPFDREKVKVAISDKTQKLVILEWNEPEVQPTQEQLDALEAEATTLENNNQVIETRKKLYGTPQEQIENIMENGLQSEIDRVNQIKTENPKS
jgi:hypothetical protein